MIKRAEWPVPPHLFFLISPLFHYLGPAFAVLLFARLDVLGVMWLRIASAAAVFAVWRRPWRVFARLTPEQRWLLAGLGVTLALMNSSFYEAIARLPLSTVAAIEFVGPIVLAAHGANRPCFCPGRQRRWAAAAGGVGGRAARVSVRLRQLHPLRAV